MIKPTKSNPWITLLVIISGFGLLYVLSGILIWLYLAGIVGVVGLVSVRARVVIDKLWMKLAYLMSLIFPPIVLTLIYFAVLTPIAWISRLLRRNGPMQLKNNKQSFFIERNHQFTKVDLERMG
ncbi:MAG: hypothetical protein Salg2KO_03610 [Salibacteraceae bacterium]